MRSRDRRFLGKTREWTIVCPQCRAVSKPIKSGRSGSSLPPEIIVKKLIQAGWQVGDNPKHDLCPDCIRKPIKDTVKTAAKVLNDVMAPMVAVNGNHRVHFTELKAVATTLDADLAKELIEVLRQRIQPKPPKKPKAEPPPRMAQSDYEKWLDEMNQENG